MIVPGAVVLAGCTTPYSDRQNVEMRQRAELGNMKADMERLQARVDGLATAQEDLFRRVESLQVSADRARQDQNSKIAETSRGVKATAAAREQLKKEIVDGLSQKIVEVMKAQQPPPTARNQRGYEHTVEPGQTISEIATAYTVTVKAIVDANGLTNPNQIRVGQKLFIPE